MTKINKIYEMISGKQKKIISWVENYNYIILETELMNCKRKLFLGAFYNR